MAAAADNLERRRQGPATTNRREGDVFDSEFFTILAFESDGLRVRRHADGDRFEGEVSRRHRDPRADAFATQFQFGPGFSFALAPDLLPSSPDPWMERVEDQLDRSAFYAFDNVAVGGRGRPERVRRPLPVGKPRRPPMFGH